jgi:hypothetical protein
MTDSLPFPTPYTIVRLVAVVRASVIVRLPAIAEQDVTFAEAGPVVLCIEQPQLSGALSGVDFAMRDGFGHDVPSTPIIFRTKVAGFSRVRLSVRSFEIAHAGRYRLIANGIASGQANPSAAIVFARPFAGAMVLWILGIVLGGFGLIGGIVLTALAFAGPL